MANELITMDKSWETRDHRKVRLLAMDIVRNAFPIIGIVTQPDGIEEVRTWQKNGAYCSDGQVSNTDLIHLVAKHEAWGVITGVRCIAPFVFSTRELAVAAARDGEHVALLSWEE